MIVDLPSTSTKAVSKRLVSLRHEVGAMAMGRVLTLLVDTGEDRADDAIAAANEATRQHPARIIVLVRGNRRGADRLDGQIRVGGDAGASEIIVLRMYGELADHAESVVTPLLLPDSPVVAWWPHEPPADVAHSPVGAMARRRITDAGDCVEPVTQLRARAQHYQPGDTDLAWTRVTRWRALLAAALDQPPYEPVSSATVTSSVNWAQAELLSGWLADALGAPVTLEEASTEATGITAVRLNRASGPVELVLDEANSSIAALTQPGQPERRVALHRPGLSECLAGELRQLDADETYARALQRAATADEQGPLVSPSTADHSSTTEVLANPQLLAEALAHAIHDRLRSAVRERSVGHLVLTGGSMGAATVKALAHLPADPATWSQVHLWWGDERFVPAGHEDRNVQQAIDAGLDALGVPTEQVHAAPANDDSALEATDAEGSEVLARAAERYAEELKAHAPAGQDCPEFDILLLGLGPDAHLASLFPGRSELAITDRTTEPISGSPKPPPLRVTLTVPALNRARALWFVVAGSDKAAAVARSRATKERNPDVPASWLAGSQETVWWLDEGASGPKPEA